MIHEVPLCSLHNALHLWGLKVMLGLPKFKGKSVFKKGHGQFLIFFFLAKSVIFFILAEC